MKKIICLMLCVFVLILCSCSKKSKSFYKEVEDYKKGSSLGYTIKYDDNLFEFIKTDDFDYLILKSDIEKDNTTNYALTISKIDNENAEEYAKEVEEFYKSGDSSVDDSTLTVSDSQTLENAKCVSAMGLDGEEVFESQLVQDGNDVFWIRYQFSTSLDSVAIENAIYAAVSSFKLK